MEILEEAIKRLEANSGHDRNSQRAQDIRLLIAVGKVIVQEAPKGENR